METNEQELKNQIKRLRSKDYRENAIIDIDLEDDLSKRKASILILEAELKGIQETKTKISKEINKNYKSLYTSILLWFLSDNIKIDEKRLKNLFQNHLNLLKKEIIK